MSKSRMTLLNQETTHNITSTQALPSQILDGVHSVCLVAGVDVAAVAVDGIAEVKSSLIVEDLTYTSKLVGTLGDAITIAYVAGTGAESPISVAVATKAISVTLATDALEAPASTADAIKAAIEAIPAAHALVTITVSGTGTDVQSAAAAAPLAGGVDSNISAAYDSITKADHGLITGIVGQLTTDGTLPTGWAALTNYYVVAYSENVIKLASSYANAVAGTIVAISNDGVGTVTFTPTALAGGAIKLQKSIDNSTWIDVGSSSTNVTADANIMWEVSAPAYQYIRAYATITAGQMAITQKLLLKGE